MFVRLFRHPDIVLIGHLRNLIEHAGMPCDLRHWSLASAMGGLPPAECEAELWVAEHNLARARDIVRDAFSAPADAGPLWQCRGCGERLAMVFDSCWQCGRART